MDKQTKSVNNLNIILDKYLRFSEGYFYYIQIIQRKKENPELGNNSTVIKNYYVESEEYLLKKWGEMVKLADLFNARIMIRLDARNYTDVAWLMNGLVSENLRYNPKCFSSLYSNACGKYKGKDKLWIVDIDEEDNNNQKINEIIRFINNECMDIKNNEKVKGVIPSKNGVHIISSGFNMKQFKDRYPNIDVHKNNPTNLYIP